MSRKVWAIMKKEHVEEVCETVELRGGEMERESALSFSDHFQLLGKMGDILL